MAQANGSIEIEVSINGAEAEAGLAKIGDALKDTAKDVEKMGDKTSSAFDELDGSADDAAKAIKKMSKSAQKDLAQLDKKAQQLDGLDSLKDTTGELDSTLKGLGGAVGLVSPELEKMLFVAGELSGGLEASSRLTTLFKTSLAAVVSPAGLVTIGVAGLAAGLVYLATRTDEVTVDLEKMAEAMESAEQVALSLEEIQLQISVESGDISRFDQQLQLVERRTREQFATAMENVRGPLGLAGERVRDLTDQLDIMASRLGETGGTQLAASQMVELQGELDQARVAYVDLLNTTEAGQQIISTMGNLDEIIEGRRTLIELRRDAAGAADRQRSATERATAAQLADAQAVALANLNRSHAMALLQQIDPATATYAATVNALNEALDQGLDAEIHRASMLQADIQLETDRAAAVESTTEALVKQSTFMAQLATEKAAQFDAEIQRDKDLASAKGTALEGMFALGHQLAGDDAEKQKGLAIAQTTISGLEAGIRAFADLGFPAGAIAAGGIAAMTAANIAAIAGTDVSMHAGGIVGGVGDVGIRAQGGEAVLNREAVAGLGERGVAALNAGGAASGSITVEMGYKGRIYDRLTIDALRKGGPLSNAMQRAERRGRRGRVGGLL